MSDKKTRQLFFVARELRLSITFIALWSLLAALLLIYIAKELGGALPNYHLLPFLVVMLGYAAVVVAFSIFFSNRFIGPFERLKIEMRLILRGDYKKRLSIRKRDDIYIKSFVEELNELLRNYESNRRFIEDLALKIDAEFMNMISGLKAGDLSKELQYEGIVQSYEKVKAMFRQRGEEKVK